MLKVAEAAKKLAIKESTMRAWVFQRRVGYVRVNGRSIRIPEAEIERIIEKGTVPAREEDRNSHWKGRAAKRSPSRSAEPHEVKKGGQ